MIASLWLCCSTPEARADRIIVSLLELNIRQNDQHCRLVYCAHASKFCRSDGKPLTYSGRNVLLAAWGMAFMGTCKFTIAGRHSMRWLVSAASRYAYVILENALFVKLSRESSYFPIGSWRRPSVILSGHVYLQLSTVSMDRDVREVEFTNAQMPVASFKCSYERGCTSPMIHADPRMKRRKKRSETDQSTKQYAAGCIMDS